jgi:hypothetical protein
VYVAYIDESGDDGEQGSQTYSLGCVMVDGAAWAEAFDRLISFRRFVRQRFGLRVRDEIKANYLIRNGGPFRELGTQLSEEARFKLYRGCLRIQPKLGLTTFAVVVNKARANERDGLRPASDIAWEYLLQRLERRASHEKTEVLVIHDEGDALTIRKRTRKARRAGTAGSAFGTGLLNVPFRRLLDDPTPRRSHESYFIQLADMNAYAAFRRLHPPPERPVQIVPQNMWDELGDARFRPVRSAQYGDPPGIVPGP